MTRHGAPHVYGALLIATVLLAGCGTLGDRLDPGKITFAGVWLHQGPPGLSAVAGYAGYFHTCYVARYENATDGGHGGGFEYYQYRGVGTDRRPVLVNATDWEPSDFGAVGNGSSQSFDHDVTVEELANGTPDYLIHISAVVYRLDRTEWSRADAWYNVTFEPYTSRDHVGGQRSCCEICGDKGENREGRTN